MLETLKQGDPALYREDGKLRRAPRGGESRWIDFGKGSREAVLVKAELTEAFDRFDG